MTRPIPPGLTANPASLAMIEQGICASHADLDRGLDRETPCGFPVDPASLVLLCTEHDALFRQDWPHWYASLVSGLR